MFPVYAARNPINERPDLMARLAEMESMDFRKEIANIDRLLMEVINGRFKEDSPIDILSIYLFQCVLWRGEELRQNALHLIRLNQWLTSPLIIRALMELAAVSYVVDKNIALCISNPEKIPEVQEFTKRLMEGTRLPKSFWERGDESFEPTVIQNILNFLDMIVKDEVDPEARTMYEIISEFCHPNHAVPRRLIVDNIEYNSGTRDCSEKYMMLIEGQLKFLYRAIDMIKISTKSSVTMVQNSVGLDWDDSAI